MKKLLCMMLLFLCSSLVSAQQTEDWTYSSQCITEVSETPADWSFSGTILMRGYAGLHGYQQSWETPHVLIPEAQMPDTLTDFGSLSPDQNWYAYILGDVFREVTMTVHANIEGIRVINLEDPSISYELDAWSQIYGFYGYQPVPLWLDKEHIYFRNFVTVGDQIWNPFTDESQDSELGYSILHLEDLYYFSPDRSHHEKEIDDPLFWLPDSSAYLLAETTEDDLQSTLKIVSDEETITFWELPPNHRIRNGVGGFSPDGRYAALIVETVEEIENPGRTFTRVTDSSLHILDMQEKHILETCLSLADYFNHGMSLAWSPDSTQIAFFSRTFKDTSNNLYPILVLDVENESVYRVGYQIGAARMLAWRD